MRIAIALFLTLGLCACPAGTPSTSDAGDGMPDAGAEPCPPGQARGADGACAAAGWTSCAEGFAADPSGAGCAPVMPTAACPAGTYPVLGKTDCQPVGVRSCPAGFVLDSSGWGCAPVLPPQPCSGATLDKLGFADCQPLGDCAATFPPAQATLFVDDSYSAPQVDATHFTTLTAAVAAASDGAVIAVEEGLYPESIRLTKSVKIVGRCAEKVVMQGSPSPTNKGIAVASGTSEVSGLTVRGFSIGVIVGGGAKLTLSGSLVTGNLKAGLWVQEAGSSLHAVRSALRDNLVDSSTGKRGDGALAGFGAELLLEECALTGNRSTGAFGQSAGTKLALLRSVVRDTRPNDLGAWGLGVEAMDGASVSVKQSAILGGSVAGFLVLTATGVVEESTISGVRSGADSNGAKVSAGLVEQGGTLTVSGSTIADCEQHAAYLSPSAQATFNDLAIRGIAESSVGPALAVAVGTGSKLTAKGLALVDNHGIALTAQDGGEITVSDSLVRGTLPLATVPGSGFGVSVRASGKMTAARLAMIENASAAFSVSDPTASATAEAMIIVDTKIAPLADDASRYGLGVRVVEGKLDLSRSYLKGNAGAAVLIDSKGTEVRISDTLIRDGVFTEDGQRGYGIAVQHEAQLTLERSGLVNNRTAGLAITLGSRATVKSTLVSGTLADRFGDYGFGVMVNGAAAELADVASVLNQQSSLVVSLPGAQAKVSESILRGPKTSIAGTKSLGLVVVTGARADLTRCSLEDHQEVGIAVDDAAATVAASQLVRNTIGINVTSGSTLSEKAAVPDAVGATEVVVTSDTVFSGNQTRVGTGSVPLPPMPTAF